MTKDSRDNTKLIGLLENSIRLHHECIETMEKMIKMAHIANLLGRPLKEVKGKVSSGVTCYGTSLLARPWIEEYYRVSIDGEEVFKVPLKDVPLALWPADMRAEYERHLRRVAAQKQRREEMRR